MLGCLHSPSVSGGVARQKSRQTIASRGWGAIGSRERESRVWSRMRVVNGRRECSRERESRERSRESESRMGSRMGSRNGVVNGSRESESRMGVAKIKNQGANGTLLFWTTPTLPPLGTPPGLQTLPYSVPMTPGLMNLAILRGEFSIHLSPTWLNINMLSPLNPLTLRGSGPILDGSTNTPLRKPFTKPLNGLFPPLGTP